MGFIVGDGVDNGNATEVRLCGEKIKFANYFKMAGFSNISVSLARHTGPSLRNLLNLIYSRAPLLSKASGGSMSGAVFHNISEGVMAKNLKLSVEDARDSLSSFTPDVKQGNRNASDYVLSQLGLKAGNEVSDADVSAKVVPDLRGMGARDAVYALEQRGLKVRLHGTGRVHHPSIAPGSQAVKGITCELSLD